MYAGRVAAGRGDALLCLSNLGSPSGPGGRWAAGRGGGAHCRGGPGGGEPGGARARTQRRGHARPLSFTFTLTAGGRRMGLPSPITTSPSPQPTPSPPLSCPDFARGWEGGMVGRCKGAPVAAAAGQPRALRSDVNRIRRSTAPPIHPHLGPRPRCSPRKPPSGSSSPGTRSWGRAGVLSPPLILQNREKQGVNEPWCRSYWGGGRGGGRWTWV